MLYGDWNWEVISEHVSMNDLRKHPDETWDRPGLSRNPNLTPDIVWLDLETQGQAFPLADGSWSLLALSTKDWITIPMILALTGGRRNIPTMVWDNLTRNLPLNQILSYPELPWNEDIIYEREQGSRVRRAVPPPREPPAHSMREVYQEPERYWDRGQIPTYSGFMFEDIERLERDQGGYFGRRPGQLREPTPFLEPTARTVRSGYRRLSPNLPTPVGRTRRFE